jgi:muramoyltetrapeptide carboxypeptidase
MNTAYLNPGDTIGLMAPSSYVERADIEKSKALLEARGYKIFIHEQTYARHHQSAGTHSEKLEALHTLYVDKNIKAIWAAGGGNRSLYLLNDIDYALIKKNPKPLIGFSDVTGLLNAIYAHTGAINIHAQVFKNLHKNDCLETALDVLSGKSHSMNLESAQILNPGKTQGRLIGGNLSVFQYLVGTKDCPDLSGAILFLEDCGDEISRFDRMLAHLGRHGVFEKISGLVLGEFTDIQDTGRPFGFGLEDCLMENLKNRDIPVILKAPLGHGAQLSPLPVGGMAVLDTAQKNLTF